MSAQKELGQRSKEELESLFGSMYAGWDRGVVVTQERFGDGETRFAERAMTNLELAARYVAAEIGANIFEIANRAAFAPIITFSQIQAHIGPTFDAMAGEIEALKADLARTMRNRDMWKGQCERQADQLRAALPASAGVEEMVRAAIAALCADAGGAGLSDCSGDCVCYRDAHTAVTAALAARAGSKPEGDG